MVVPPAGDARIQVAVAGVFTVTRRGVPVAAAELGSRKARALLKILVAQRPHALRLDRIAEILWGADPPQRAAENVATLVSRLRRELGGDAIVGGREGYRLGSSVEVDLDVAARWVTEAQMRAAVGEFGLAVAAADRALDVLVPGIAFEDEPDAEWAEPARAQARALLRDGRHVLADAALGTGDHRRALASAAAALVADPYDEIAGRSLMRAHSGLGEPGRALAVYAELRELLSKELGADPAAETQALHLALLRDESLPVAPVGHARGDRAAESLGIVGRQDELRELRSAWNAAATGRSSLLLLVGAAGMGKTRLADELVRIARATGGIVLHARCHETERSLFLQPVVEAISSTVRTLSAEAIHAAARDVAATLAGLVPDVASVLGVVAERHSSAEIQRRRAFDATTTFIAGLATRAPVLLILDDLHNAGRATVELLHYLSRQVAASRTLIVATVRVGEGDAVLDSLADVATRLDIGPLPAEAVAQLAAAAGQAELADTILRRTSGHALFVVETLRGLAAGETGVPGSLQDAVLSRVRRAGRPVEELLRAGAVLGASFDPGTAARLLDEPLGAVAGRCEDALARRLLVASGREYEFANDLVREVLYDMTPLPTRTAYHLRAADLLTDRPESVAMHAAAAQDWSRAARAWLLAGEAALRHFAADDADGLLTRCLDASRQGGDLEVHGRALVARARARETLADYGAAMVDLEAAVSIARDIGDRRLEMIALRELGGEAPVALGHSAAQAEVHLHRGLQISISLSDRAMEADFLAWLAVIAANGLRFDEAVEHGQRAVAAARSSGNDEALAAALDGRKTSLAYLGEIDELVPVLDELEPLLRRLNDPFRLHWTLFESGFPAVAAGNWPVAAAHFENALATNRRTGFTAYACWHIAHLGWLARLQGNYDRALELGWRALELNEDRPHAWCGATTAALLGATLLETGAIRPAIEVLDRGRELAVQDGSEAYLLRCLAPLAEATGSSDVLADADAMLAAIEAPPGSAWLAGDAAYLAVARGWLNHGDPARAREVLAPMLAAARRVPWIAVLADGCLVDGQAAAALGDDDEARALLVEAIDLADRFGLPRVSHQAAAALARAALAD